MAKHLVIQTAYLGDLLLTIPLLRHVKKSHSQDELWLLCKAGLGDFFRVTGLVDRVIEVDKKSSESWANAERELKKENFEWVVSPHESLTTAKFVRGLSATKKIGYTKWWNFWAFNYRTPRPLQYPEAIRQMHLLERFDEDLKLQLLEYKQNFHVEAARILEAFPKKGETQWVPEWASMSLKALLKEQLMQKNPEMISAIKNVERIVKMYKWHERKLALIAPGSVWGTKRWTEKGFIELGKKLSYERFRVGVIGAPEENEIAERIANNIPEGVNLIGKTSLLESSLLMTQAEIVITNDSGAMHLAAAMETPSISVFGPTTLDIGYRPWQNRALVVQNHPLSCRPCGKHGPQKCPIGTHECMESITAEVVWDAYRSIREQL